MSLCDVRAADGDPLEQFGGRMESVLRKQVVNIDDVEDHGHAPVGNYREHQGEDIIGDG